MKDFSQVNWWGLPVMLLGLVLVLTYSRLSEKFFPTHAETAKLCIRLAGLAVVIYGTLITMKFI